MQFTACANLLFMDGRERAAKHPEIFITVTDSLVNLEKKYFF